MKIRQILFLGVVFLSIGFALNGCGGGSNDDTKKVNPIEREDAMKNASSYYRPIESQEEFFEYVKTGLKNPSAGYRYYGYEDAVAMDEPMAANEGAEGEGSASQETGGSSDTSETNLIVEGVDESDLIKTDGKYLYVAKVNQEEVYYYDKTSEVIKGTEIKIFSITPDPATADEVASIKINNDDGISSTEIFLADGDKKQLIAVSRTSGNYSYYTWDSYWYGYQQNIQIDYIDISDPESPAVIDTMIVDGRLVQSRIIGNKLYLISRYTPYLEGYYMNAYNDEELESNKRVVEEAPNDQLLPKFVSTRNGEQSIYVDNCVIKDDIDETSDIAIGYADITSIVRINVDSGILETSSCFAGGTSGFLATKSAIYFTESNWNFYPILEDDVVMVDEDSLETRVANSIAPNETKTLVHKFSIADDFYYEGSGSVVGRLGGSNTKFSMAEVNGDLVVVTTGSGLNHRLTVLRSAEGKLNSIAGLPNEEHPEKIGKPGESLYAVRIINERAYLVTFLQTDPLYVIDLSDTENPEILGELEIPGFSEYLHPIGDNLLLGIGNDAISNDAGNWYQGVKVALFDVTDPVNPIEIQQYIVGDRGSSSAVDYNHKSITFLMGNEDRPHRIALPIQVNKVKDNGIYVCETTECTTNEEDEYGYPEYGSYVHSGLYTFEVEQQEIHGISSLSYNGSIVEQKSDDGYYYYGSNNKRSVIQGDAVHYITEDKIFSADWFDPQSDNYIDF